MGRNPGETTEQWSVRANAEYQAAWDAFGLQRHRIATVTGSGDAGEHQLYPLFDEAYDGALDRLEDADNERGAAAITLDRELAAGMSAGRAGG